MRRRHAGLECAAQARSSEGGGHLVLVDGFARSRYAALLAPDFWAAPPHAPLRAGPLAVALEMASQFRSPAWRLSYDSGNPPATAGRAGYRGSSQLRFEIERYAPEASAAASGDESWSSFLTTPREWWPLSPSAATRRLLPCERARRRRIGAAGPLPAYTLAGAAPVRALVFDVTGRSPADAAAALAPCLERLVRGADDADEGLAHTLMLNGRHVYLFPRRHPGAARPGSGRVLPDSVTRVSAYPEAAGVAIRRSGAEYDRLDASALAEAWREELSVDEASFEVVKGWCLT